MIKTITVSGDTEVKIVHSERFIWMKNLSSEDIYASANGEDFAVIPSGHSLRFENSPEHTIFFRGSGDVELYSSDSPESPYRIAGSSGGGSGSAVLINKNITENGTYSASNDNADGYSSVTVDVPASANLQELTVSETGTYLPDAGFDGFSKVTVQSSDEILQTALVGVRIVPKDSSLYVGGKYIDAELYINGELYSSSDGTLIFIRNASDHVDSVSIVNYSVTRNGSIQQLNLNVRFEGWFYEMGQGQKSSATGKQLSFRIEDLDASLMNLVEDAWENGRFAFVVDV